jgi:predicted unusual protein kinase regulating ubiquinone biosynthesis (AarF/ABC1/UbiB family)
MFRHRYRKILWFFAGILLSLLWWDVLLPQLGGRGLSARGRAQRYRRMAIAFRRLAVDMGGVMIKVGQFLSARLDVLPREITDELAGLQDEVQAEPFAQIRAVVEAEFGQPLDTLFCRFGQHPLAAASIGQVHVACLAATQDGAQQDVVVKVKRPHIDRIVEVDLAALRVVSRWVRYYRPVRRRVDTNRLLDEFSASLHEEIDYLQEGHNAETFAENFREQPGVRVPRVFWERTTGRVLTLEDVRAIKISDYPAIDAAGVDRKVVAERLFGFYLKQIFEDQFFHADPHPGNLFVRPPSQEGADWQLVFIDFGMVGHLPAATLAGLREAIIAVGTQDAARLVRSYQQLGVLLPGADLELLERANAEAFSRFWGRTAPELASLGREDISDFAHEFSALLYDMPFQVPENFILLGRCISILSGICTGLDEDFNFWEQIAPYAQKLVEAERGGAFETALRELVETVRLVAGLPRRGEALMARIEQGKLSLQIPELKRSLERLEHSDRSVGTAVICGACLLAAVQLYLAGEAHLAMAAGAGAGIFLLAWLLQR